MLCLLVRLSLISLALAAEFKCSQSNSYPYCVYKPDGSSKLPLSVFLPGSGARGDLSNARSLAQFDGPGKAISMYLSGNKNEQTISAAEDFLTVIPIQSKNARHYHADKVKQIIDEVRANYDTDGRLFISGYSMGSRGCWRFMTAYPQLVTAAACSAGSAEVPGASTLTSQGDNAPPTFTQLQNIIDIPIHQYAGTNDKSAGTKSPEQTQSELTKLGGKLAKLIELQGATHSDMSTAPWLKNDALSFLLSVKAASGVTTTEPSQTTDGDSDSSQDSDEEDCEDEETSTDGTSADGDEEDCEDEEPSSGTGEDSSAEDGLEDCDQDSGSDDTSSDDDTEDCDAEEDSTPNITDSSYKRSQIQKRASSEPNHDLLSRDPASVLFPRLDTHSSSGIRKNVKTVIKRHQHKRSGHHTGRMMKVKRASKRV